MSDLTRRRFIEMMATATGLPVSLHGETWRPNQKIGASSPTGELRRPSRKLDFGLAQGPSAPQLENLALHAQAAGSPGAVSEGSPYPATGSAEVIAGYVNDGDLDTLWGYTEPAPTGAWLSLTWPQPITFRQILVRQNLDRDLTQITLEVREGGQWKTLKMLGDGNIPLPKLILIELPAQTTDAIRLTRLKGVPSFYEVEVYEGPNPPVINLAGDAAGRIIGMVSDAFGAGPKTGAPITISGQAGHKLWQVRLCTDEHGMFTVATPAGLLGLIRVDAQVGAEHIEHKVDAADLALKLTPPNDLESAIDLNGSWKFAPDPPAEFHRPDFADVRWRVIEVPSHWVMQGFQSEHGVCGYRRQFQLPTAWTGQRIKIRFEGVYSGAEVWLNGQRAGWHEGGFTPFEVDITNAANPGVNVLALRVTENTPSTSLDHMSFYADFPLAGIFRRAYAFAVPIAHVERFHIATLFDSNFQDAVLRIDLRLVNEGAERFRNAEVRWELQSPDGTPVMAPFSKSRFNLPAWSHLERTIDIPISRPQHWEAEHPKLYRLTASLYVNGTKVEQVSRRIGFRQVDIRGTQVLINGTAVKFRGACHHDSHPVMGRAVTPEVTRQDLELIKEANLDALRTSHYPAVEELYDYADEMGVYIEAEAPFCWVDRSHDLRLVPLVVQHTAELLERDRSHPSVIWWSLCNESSWGPVFERSHEYVKRSDPTRPTSAAATQDLDLATRHNPITLDRMQQSNSSKVPVIWDESLCVFQGMYQDGPELWRDPGERDYYIVPLIPIWDALLASDVIQGSMIWAWSDDIFQVPGRGSEFGRRQTRVHGVDQLYGAPGKGVVGDAPWGVVDGWRRKKPEFWHTKKLHSPIKVLTLELPAPSAGNLPPLRIHNRYEFTNLEELTLSWEFGEEKGQIHPRIAPQRIGEVQIPVRQAATPGSYLTIRFLNRDGKLVDEEEIRVASEAIPVRRPVVTPLKHRKEKLLEGNLLCIRGEHFEIAFETDGSGIRRLLVDGRALLFETPVPHILPTNPSQSEVPSTWSWQPVKPVAVAREGENMIVTAAVRYREVEGNVTYRIMPAGELLVSYDVKYLGPELYAHEVGLRFGLPPWMDILEWERKGEWSAYPEDHVGRNRGKASGHPGIQTEIPPVHSFSQDDSALGSNDFRSIKRHFKCASLVSREGYGLQILSDGKQHLRAMVKPDHIAVHVCDWFGGTASTAEEWKLNYGNGRVLETNDTLKGALHLRLVTPGL